MTCRQFPNLTFAPRKNLPHRVATSRFTAIMPQQLLVYTPFCICARVFQCFIVFFLVQSICRTACSYALDIVLLYCNLATRCFFVPSLDVTFAHIARHFIHTNAIHFLFARALRLQRRKSNIGCITTSLLHPNPNDAVFLTIKALNKILVFKSRTLCDCKVAYSYLMHTASTC